MFCRNKMSLQSGILTIQNRQGELVLAYKHFRDLTLTEEPLPLFV